MYGPSSRLTNRSWLASDWRLLKLTTPLRKLGSSGCEWTRAEVCSVHNGTIWGRVMLR